MSISKIVGEAHARGARAGRELLLSSSLDLQRRAERLIAQARAEGFRLCQEMAAATIIDAADMNGQVYAMRAAADVRALKVEGE